MVSNTVSTQFSDQETKGGAERTELSVLVKSWFRSRYRSLPQSGFGKGSYAGEGVTGERKVRDHLREIKSVTPSLVSGP